MEMTNVAAESKIEELKQRKKIIKEPKKYLKK